MVTTRTLASLAAFISLVVWRSGRLAKNNIFRTHNFPPGYFSNGDFDTNCATLKNPDLKYCEDITFWDHLDGQGNFVDHRLLISCDANRKAWNTVMGPLRDPNPRGSLWLYKPEKAAKGAKVDPSKLTRLELKGFPAGHDFHPLGLEAYPSYARNASNLYVVNHARARTVIEQFTLSPSEPHVATYVRTLVSPYFLSANSIALTSPDSFYVTNDHLITRRLPYLGRFLPVIESVFALPLSFVSHITLSPPSSNNADPTPPIQSHEFSILFLPFSNGISLSPDGKHVAIASTSLGTVFVYARNPTTNALSQVQAVPVPFTPDNIQYTHDGSAIIVAGHPHFPTLTKVAGNKSDVAPSWVASITLTDANVPPPSKFDTQAPVSAKGMVLAVAGYEVNTLFQSDGSGFSSSSTGLRDPVTGVLYVSGLYAEEGVIVCRPTPA